MSEFAHAFVRACLVPTFGVYTKCKHISIHICIHISYMHICMHNIIMISVWIGLFWMYIYIHSVYIHTFGPHESPSSFCWLMCVTHTHTHKNTHAHTLTHTHAHTHTHTLKHTHTHTGTHTHTHTHTLDAYLVLILAQWVAVVLRGGGLGSRPKKMYGERLGDGVEYHFMKTTPRR